MPDSRDAARQKIAQLQKVLREAKRQVGPATADEAYREHRKSAGSRQARVSAAGRDIGELPAVADPERRARCQQCLRSFCEAYLPKVFFRPWSEDHRRIITAIERRILSGGCLAIAMPRGSGKTALTYATILWAMLFGHHRFVGYIAAESRAGKAALDAIKTHLLGTPELAADFPEVCFPVAQLGGIAQRRLIYHGERLDLIFSRSDLVLPAIAGAPSCAARLKVAGIGSAIRGMNYTRPDGTMVRPSLLVIDDPQTDKSAKNPAQCDERETLLKGAVLGLADDGRATAAIMPCTVIRKGDLADRMLDRKQNPQWQGERTKALYAMPASMDLWHRYREVRAESFESGGDGSAGTDFYGENREAMDAGAAVAWPERFVEGELSALQHCMNLLFDRGKTAFSAEYQNEPEEADQGRGRLTVEGVIERVNHRQRGTVPQKVEHLTAMVDVHDEVLYWLISVWEPAFAGYVVDYGVWPAHGRPLSQQYPSQGKGGAVYAGLVELLTALLSRELPRDDGTLLNIQLCLVDTGYFPDVVGKAIRQVGHGPQVLPSRGQGIGPTRKPFSQYKPEPGVKMGRHWRRVKAPATQLLTLLIDVNYWKSFLRDRLLTPVGDPGALTLFGDRPEAHRTIAGHISAEIPIEGSGPWGIVEDWRLIPGRDNHLFDCAVGTAAAACYLGARLPEWEEVRRSVGRQSLSDLARG